MSDTPKKMCRKQLTALRASITKWQRYARRGLLKEERLGCESCPLCRANRVGCEPCPVYQKTGRYRCEETPFRDALQASIVRGPKSLEFRKAAAVEVKFLKSLLPPVKRKK